MRERAIFIMRCSQIFTDALLTYTVCGNATHEFPDSQKTTMNTGSHIADTIHTLYRHVCANSYYLLFVRQ
jgi:hypothetical protein